MRDHNERVVLSLLREHGALSKSDIARLASLSAQTASVIMRALEADGLILRGAPQRGKIGQPSVPMSLNPDGAYFLGLKIGRRSAELVLIDFLGKALDSRQYDYPYPTPENTTGFAREAITTMRAKLTPAQDARIAGLGIAIPFELWNWAENAGAPPGAMDGWRDIDVREVLQGAYNFPVYMRNDASAACAAELVFGDIGKLRDFIYFYVGAFAGGGIVLNRRLHVGPSGNAGALGSMPVPGPNGKPVQLIDVASLATLEKQLQMRGENAGFLWSSPQDWNGYKLEADGWFSDAGRALAYAIISASAVLDFEAAIIDGWMPERVRKALVEATRAAFKDIDVEGLAVPAIREGTIGVSARAIGGASLPLSERFLAAPASGAT